MQMTRNKGRVNPFVGLTTRKIQSSPAILVPWIWKLKGLVPDGKDMSFEKFSHRPGVYRPLLSALWRSCVDSIPPVRYDTLEHHRRYLEKFEIFLATHSDPLITQLSSLTLLTRELLVDYRAWLFRELKPYDARKAYRSLIKSLLALRDKMSPWPGMVKDDLIIPTKSLLPSDYGSSSIGTYTKDEQAILEFSCKSSMNSTIERLNEGKRLLDEGQDISLYTSFFINKINGLWEIFLSARGMATNANLVHLIQNAHILLVF